MDSCIKKHIVSIASANDVKMYPDNVVEFTTPQLLESLDISREALAKEINELRASGILTLKDAYQTIACPSCGSPDPFTKLVCPKCGSGNLKVEGSKVKCLSCGIQTDIYEALSFVCKTCGNTFNSGNARWVTLGALHAVNATGIEGIAETLKNLGIYAKRCMAVTGSSGIIHRFDFVFERNGSKDAVDVAVDSDVVNVKHLIEFISKAYDSGIGEGYFIAVPGLNVSVDLGKKGIKVIEAHDINEASDMLKQILVKRGITSKIVH